MTRPLADQLALFALRHINADPPFAERLFAVALEVGLRERGDGKVGALGENVVRLEERRHVPVFMAFETSKGDVS